MSEQADGPQFDSAPQQSSAPADTGQQSAAPDPVMARLDEITGRLDSLVQPQQDASDYSLDDLLGQGFGEDPYAQQDPQGFDQGQPQGFDQDQFDQQQALQQLDQLIGQRANDVVAPLMQRFEQMQTQQHAAQLEAKYPELKNGEVASTVVKEAVQTAQRIGYEKGLSPQQVAALSRDPHIIELTYLAQRARQQAAQETPVSGNQVHLESTGANPGGVEEDYASRIVNLGPQQGGGFNWI